ncbi:MAG: hypothetical protein ACREH9_02770, partial [Pseudomonadota bacterium]
MRRSVFIALVATLLLGKAGAATAGWLGPVPGVTGNDTGGIIPYSPAIAHVYRQMAAAHCARWGRLSHITSVNRRYGDFIGFVCIDKPG